MAYIAYYIGLIGVWMIADGVASLWTYYPAKNETFWRNHALRLFRSFLGLILVILGWFLMGV